MFFPISNVKSANRKLSKRKYEPLLFSPLREILIYSSPNLAILYSIRLKDLFALKEPLTSLGRESGLYHPQKTLNITVKGE